MRIKYKSSSATSGPEKRTKTLADLYDIRFKTRDHNLSKKVDKILYDNPYKF